MPGESFGRAGRGHVRISLTANEDDVSEACKRIVRYARRLMESTSRQMIS
jgi:aspartate/methionine/tyrosine aminotransferase